MAPISERARIAHLLRRAGFGAGEAELDEYAALGFEASVERLVNPERVADDLDERLAALKPDYTRLADIQRAWLFRMVHTKRPLQEKLALIWHNHFATANAKVNAPILMWQQYELFRSRGLGPFGELVGAVSRDPAMLLWLDGNANRTASPNENYGRELLELFTLGIGNYTEDDVQAAARAFTGWSVRAQRDPATNRVTGAQVAFHPAQHDGGVKTFLGRTGAWTGEEIVGIILEQPACAAFVARTLFGAFAWDRPDEATVAPYAAFLRRTGYDIRATLRALFLSPAFSSERAYRAKIKSPAELVAGALRTLGVEDVPREALPSMRRMGQELFNPPNVGGWTSGTGWISTSGLLERFNFANRVVTARGGADAAAFDPAALLGGKGLDTAERLADHCIALLLDGEVAPDQRAALIAYLNRDDRGQPAAFSLNQRTLDGKVRGLLHLTMASPQYQLS